MYLRVIVLLITLVFVSTEIRVIILIIIKNEYNNDKNDDNKALTQKSLMFAMSFQR